MNSLSLRLTLAFLLLTWLAVAGVALILKNTLEGGFREYVQGQEASSVPESLVTNLSTYYADNGTWDGAEISPTGRNRQSNGSQGRQYFVLDLTQTVVASSNSTRLGEFFPSNDLEIPLEVDGQTVGWLTWETPGQQRFGAAEQAFLDDMTQALLGVGLGIGLLSLGVGMGLAWQLTRPLRHLTLAVQDVSAGQRGQQVRLGGTREVQDLALAFNHMSTALERSEQARQRLAADVAHELRTPLTVLSGHLEGMLDEVLPNSKEQIALAYDQTLHLKRLVEDLRLLTLAEIRQLPLEKRPLKPSDFLNGLYAAFEPLTFDQEIVFEREIPPDLPILQADEGRLRQVFGNLLANALHHTPIGGTIRLEALAEAGNLVCRVVNSGQGISGEEVTHLFDPFWRADEARSRDQGGSGLGLAIVKNLVELHDGSISATSEAGQTIFEIVLPA